MFTTSRHHQTWIYQPLCWLFYSLSLYILHTFITHILLYYSTIFTVVAKIRTLVFSPAKKRFKLFLSFAVVCQNEIVYISKHSFCHLIVIIQWYFCLHQESNDNQCSTQRSDLIIIQSVWNVMKKQHKLRQTKSRTTVPTSPRCFKKPTGCR